MFICVFAFIHFLSHVYSLLTSFLPHKDRHWSVTNKPGSTNGMNLTYTLFIHGKHKSQSHATRNVFRQFISALGYLHVRALSPTGSLSSFTILSYWVLRSLTVQRSFCTGGKFCPRERYCMQVLSWGKVSGRLWRNSYALIVILTSDYIYCWLGVTTTSYRTGNICVRAKVNVRSEELRKLAGVAISQSAISELGGEIKFLQTHCSTGMQRGDSGRPWASDQNICTEREEELNTSRNLASGSVGCHDRSVRTFSVFRVYHCSLSSGTYTGIEILHPIHSLLLLFRDLPFQPLLRLLTTLP